MHFDKAYVIGFPEQKNERLDRFFQSGRKAGVQAEVFPAVKGDAVNEKELKRKGYLSEDFHLKMPGSLGCLLSHVTLWEKIHNDPETEIALICEDDALLSPDFLTRLKDISWDMIPKDWDMVRLGCHKIIGEPVSEYALKPPAKYIKGANAGTYCYLIKSSGAMKLKRILTPYDNRRSMDVLLKTRSDRYHLYVLKTPLATEQRFRYSIRKDMNLQHRNGNFLRNLINRITARWFR